MEINNRERLGDDRSEAWRYNIYMRWIRFDHHHVTVSAYTSETNSIRIETWPWVERGWAAARLGGADRRSSLCAEG